MVACMRRLVPVLLAMLVPALPARADSAPATLILQLNGPAEFRYAGYFAALWKGFYKDSGLTVEIRPGSVPGSVPDAAQIDPANEVTLGHAQFGVGSMRLVTRAAQGQPLLLLAPIFQSSGAEIYYRTDGDFASPGALVKAKVGRLPATSALDMELATALRGDGVDPAKIHSVPLTPDKAVAALGDRTVDAIPGSAWSFPWFARDRNVAVKYFDPGDYRIEFYGDTLFTQDRFAEANPALVRRFREASLKGWAYALDHPDEIVTRLVSDLPPPPGIGDAAAFAKYQVTVAQVLSRYPAIALGHSSLERWTRIEDSLAAAGSLVRTASADRFVYDPTGRAPSPIDWRDAAIVALAVLLAAAVIVAATRRRRPAATAPLSLPAPTVVPLPLPTPPPELAAGIAAGIKPEPPSPAPPPEPREPPGPTDLNEILKALERKIRDRVPPGASFRLSVIDTLWPCRTDRDAVSALVLDLVGAAVAEMKKTDTLIVGTRNAGFTSENVGEVVGGRVGEFARITVRDSGPGFSETQLERIFDPTTTARAAVAAAWPAMNRLGGYVRAESAEGVGTAIHLYFPREEKEKSAAALEEPPAPRRYRATGSRATQRRSRSLR
jgi:ABC-type nitrate/sulfonate/bicarbonate transport system substrate-binding protein